MHWNLIQKPTLIFNTHWTKSEVFHDGFLQFWTHLPIKSFTENFIFCTMTVLLYLAKKRNCSYRRRQLMKLLQMATGNAPQINSFFSQLLNGKIYYTPDNNKTRMVINKVSRFFNIVSLRIVPFTAQKMKFSITDFFSNREQIRTFLWIWSHLLKKTVMENFIFGQRFFLVATSCG